MKFMNEGSTASTDIDLDGDGQKEVVKKFGVREYRPFIDH